MSVADEVQSGIARHRAGDLAGAERCYREALQRDPAEPTALALLGAVCLATERAAEAVCLLRRAVELRPGWAEGHEQLGLAMQAAGDGEAAVAELERATCLGPHLPSTFYNLANALRDRGEADAAIWAYRRAIGVAPDFVEALANLAGVLIDVGRSAEAAPLLERAVALRPADARLLRSLGIALRKAGNGIAAEAALRRAADLAPGDAEAWNELGGVLRERRRTTEALDCYRRACDLEPGFAPYRLNLGLAHEDEGAFADALRCYDEALRIDPEYADARLNRTIVRLTLGHWPDAWPAEGWNALMGGDPPSASPQPRWDGGELNGKTILVRAEQGYGDTIQFVRYLPMVRARGGRVVFECQPGLVELIGLAELADEVIPMRADRRVDCDFDTQIELMTLPALFATSVSSVPNRVPYLRAPDDRLRAWRRRLPEDHLPRVALAWAGNPHHRNDANRSLRLEQLGPLFDRDDVRLFSVQKGPAADALQGRGLPIVDLGPELRDFLDTAAVVSLMDLVVSVDTSVAHLAGALGAAVWMMIPRVPDWRWLLDRSDTPWYPTMRIYRQERQGDWAPVVRRLAGDLLSLSLAPAA